MLWLQKHLRYAPPVTKTKLYWLQKRLQKRIETQREKELQKRIEIGYKDGYKNLSEYLIQI